MTNENAMTGDRHWVGRYIAVIVIALILAAAIGSMELFAKTSVFSNKLSAAKLVRFLGYSAALAAFWMLGQRSTIALQHRNDRWSFLQHLILPLVSLIVVSTAYSVILLVLGPFMDAALYDIYKWLFILAILACAAWLVMAVLGQSGSLTEAFTSAAQRLGGGAKAKSCPTCGASNEPGARFCKQCGKAYASE